MRSSPGAYVLIVGVPDLTLIDASCAGRIELLPGLYLYCGSAQGGLMPRLARHMRKDKPIHWHIDRLTAVGEVVGALAFSGGKETECLLAESLSRVPGVIGVGRGFGSSDCHCPTHLFFISEQVPLEVVVDIITSCINER